MERYICIHGHFYQPPRENPWLEDVEFQDSAHPYHDWNARITSECYEPNSSSRILDTEGWIRRITNNYARISFNFGPSLLSWMETNEPEVYRTLLATDRDSQAVFSGYGSAFSQAYNHMIMPLANDRDRYTQVVWGISDFEKRFGRKPAGMWLPETAVDLSTLSIMAEKGIRFTVLAPYQAKETRPMGSGEWREVNGCIDTRMPYRVFLPGMDRTIDIFFYNADISRDVAFKKLLASGEGFAARLMEGFNGDNDSPQLVHIATDGETYGHHHRHGDMALAYALDLIQKKNLSRVTNYQEYLELHPPTHEVRIQEDTSWSCAHGIDRWKADCGCSTGMHPGWNQSWRAPLRSALDWLRDTIWPLFEEKAGLVLKDPWAARNDYISVILDRSPENLNRFLRDHSLKEPDRDERIEILKLLEMQRHSMLMYTSCGWFFDEISGIETVQVLKYAARVIQLAQELSGQSLEPRFLEMLAEAKSNIPEHKDGANIYNKFVRPAMVDLLKVGAHYAICSLFESYADESKIYSYRVVRSHHQKRLAGAAKLVIGRAGVTSEITGETRDITYSVVNFGNHNVVGGVRDFKGDESYRKMEEELLGAFDKTDFSLLIRLVDQHFEGNTYSVKQLFRDKQRQILETVLETTLADVASDYLRAYERHVPLMRFLKEISLPQPRVLFTAAEFVINTRLRQEFEKYPLDLEHIRALIYEADITGAKLDGASLGYVIENTLEKLGEKMLKEPGNLDLFTHIDEVTGLVRSLPFEIDLWKLQNFYYRLLQDVYPERAREAACGHSEARQWTGRLNSLGDKLQIRRNR